MSRGFGMGHRRLDQETNQQKIVLGGIEIFLTETLRRCFIWVQRNFLFCTDVESDQGIQGQYNMGKRIKAFNTGE